MAGSARDGLNVGMMTATDEGYAVVVFILSAAALYALTFWLPLPQGAAEGFALAGGGLIGLREYRRMKRRPDGP